jgi:hypothetical protein
MLVFGAGFLVGAAFMVFVYHFHILTQLKTYAIDWRARAISAEQEVENWKGIAKIKGWL